MRYSIVVTYGTREHQVYATADHPDQKQALADAQALAKAARKSGYHDAKIITEEAFLAAQANARESAADSRRASRKALNLHDLRPRTQKAPSRQAA